MNINTSHYFYYQKLRLKRLKHLFSWHNSVKSVKSLVNPLVMVGLSVNGLINKNIIVNIAIFAVRLLKLNKKNGLTFTAKYLKSCGLYTMKAVGLDTKHIHSCVYKDTKVSITKGGLPRIIPTYLRVQIRSRNSSAIRLVLSICNLYRVLPYKGVAKLETITAPSKFTLREDMIKFIPRFLFLIGACAQPFSFHFDPFSIKSAGSIIEVQEEFSKYYLKGRSLKYLGPARIPSGQTPMMIPKQSGKFR